MEINYHRLIFKRPSGTSRGVLRTKDSWVLRCQGAVGEVSIIDGLSRRSFEEYKHLLETDDWKNVDAQQWPALAFAKEMLEYSASDSPFHLFDTSFYGGEISIPINGLIWMGSKNYMYQQIKEKLEQGYRCLKLKIGAIDFDDELSLLRYVRSQFSVDQVELRVDANGAFTPEEAMNQLEALSQFDLHSIEQPIRAGQLEAMARLCADTPLPIALDEELIIPRYNRVDKLALLRDVQPQYIILKPSLIGGLNQADEWIEVAESMDIGWWATSALESNIGLNAISQWVSQYDTTMPQGLGTGQLYTNNFGSPLTIVDGHICYDPDRSWDLSLLDKVL